MSRRRSWRYQFEPHPMWPVLQALLAVICTVVRSRLSLQLEVVALRHQLSVCERSVKRPRLQPGDRIPRSWWSRHWSKWRTVLICVQPLTVIAWQRRRRFPQSLALDSPDSRPVQPLEQGAVVEFQEVGGLHRDYERMAGMIIGEVPKFDEVIESVRELETRIERRSRWDTHATSASSRFRLAHPDSARIAPASLAWREICDRSNLSHCVQWNMPIPTPANLPKAGWAGPPLRSTA